MNNPYPNMFPPMDQPPPAHDLASGIVPLANHILLAKLLNMFTIEHTFDCSVITLVDEGQAPLTEDVIVNVFEDSITVTQYDPRTEQPVRIAIWGPHLICPKGCTGCVLRPARMIKANNTRGDRHDHDRILLG